MKPGMWKALAIIFIILFVLETGWIFFGLYLLNQDEARMNECYYNICNDYPDAQVEGDVCFCYDYDLIGDLIVSKTEVMK